MACHTTARRDRVTNRPDGRAGFIVLSIPLVTAMMRYLKDRCHDALGRERGVVLIAVLVFIAVILPVTLLILDSVRIESLLPVNEAYTKTAGDEADKGFYDALAAVMADQDSYIVDPTVDFSDPAWDPALRPYKVNLAPGTRSSKHEIDYLAEMWARHPANDTAFLVERSLENIDHPDNPDAGPDPDVHSVPTRWQLMNVPFGMDDFGEFYNDGGDFPRILLPFEYVGEESIDRRAPAYYIDPSELSMLNGQHRGDPVSRFAYNDLDEYWRLPPSDPNYYENKDVMKLDPVVQFVPRPASYFRNTSGAPYFTGLGDVGLPANEGDADPRFIREDDDAVDRFVYDGLYDFNLAPSNYPTNQYPTFQALQEVVTESVWANPYFGSTGGSAALTATLFATTNKEYKPAAGTLTRYQLGAQERDAVPGWHEAIVSDESGRFPINNLLNIIFASHNVYYEDPEQPEVRRDLFDVLADYDAPIVDDEHPNHSGYLMARDMLISLLITDEDMARLADSFDQNRYDTFKFKANWIIRQMLRRRAQLDEASDFNRNGDYSDDISSGEIFQFPELTGNNDSDTIGTPPPGEGLYDGSGRMGDGEDVWDGTWRVFTNPKELMTDFIGLDIFNLPNETMRLSQRDFEILNQRVTVYSMDTEYCADPDHPQLGDIPIATVQVARRDVRYDIQEMWPEDNLDTTEVDESALYDFFSSLIGPQRAISIILWREGLVDLNGDGDLDDEYIEQPVSAQRLDLTNNTYDWAGDWPISTITYRERNHPNFQDPHMPAHLMDPDFLNIRSLGDLLTIPMSTIEPLVAFSEATDANDTPTLVIRKDDDSDPAGGPVSLSGRVYPDFSNGGSEIAYDDEDDVYRNNTSLTDEVQVDNQRLHPSWGPGDGVMAYYNNDSLYIHDLVTDTESAVLTNANLPPDEDDTTDNPFWDNWPSNNLIGRAVFEMASPDISPNTGNNEMAFSQVSADSTGDVFLDPDAAYNIATVALDGSRLGLVTDNDVGTFDYGPDFVGDGEFLVFTRTSYDHWWYIEWILEFLAGIPAGSIEPLPITTLEITHRTGGGSFPLIAWFDIDIGPDPEPALIEIDTDASPGAVRVKMHQPMFPSFSPASASLVFMDVPVVFDIETSAPYTITGVELGTEVRNPDILFLDFDEDDFQPFWENVRSLKGAARPDTYDIFPDWGLGSIRVAEEADEGWGYSSPDPLLMPNASLTDSPFDPAERRAIALDLGAASLALRERLGQGAEDQNWRLRDLPAVAEHVVDVLEKLGDVVCFREPLVTYDPQYQPPDPMPWPPVAVPEAPLQAYPGRVNINTADRAVLRTVFLLMFQGPDNDPDDNGDWDGPEPRIESGMGSKYVNLMNPDNAAVTDEDRFKALMVADRYAYQVCEYRKWIYDNQGLFGVTDETVPSNLPLYETAALYPDTSHYGNFRANPFYPLVDTNGDGQAPEVPRYNPEPPFRSIAGLFKVMLYEGEEFTEDWTYEGIGAFGGPDDNDLPRPKDVDGADVGTADAFDIWGPIYNADDERTVTHPSGSELGSGILYGFEAKPDNDLSDPDNDFYRHQYFRLFSADDFRRIAPFLTVRTYDYRIESRGVVRVSSGARRMDITRDKVWIITTNTEANYGSRLNPTWDIGLPLDSSFLAQNRGSDEYWVLYFEETPQSGLAVARAEFLPE